MRTLKSVCAAVFCVVVTSGLACAGPGAAPRVPALPSTPGQVEGATSEPALAPPPPMDEVDRGSVIAVGEAVSGVVVRGERVYWLSARQPLAGNVLWSAPLRGGNAVAMSRMHVGRPGSLALAVGPGYVFVADSRGVMAIPKQGGTSRRLLPGSWTALCADHEHLYAGGRDRVTVARIDGRRAPRLLDIGWYGPRAMALWNGRVMYGGQSVLRAVPVDSHVREEPAPACESALASGGAPKTRVILGGLVGAATSTLALDATHVYVPDRDGVLAVPKSGGKPKRIVQVKKVAGVAWDRDRLVWTTQGESGQHGRPGGVWRLAVRMAGARPERLTSEGLFTELGPPTLLDDGRIAFAAFNDVVVVPPEGGAVTSVLRGANAQHLAARGAELVFASEDGLIGSISPGTTELRAVASTAAPAFLLVDGDEIVWLDAADRSVWRRGQRAHAQRVAALAPLVPQRIVVHDQMRFITVSTPDGGGAVLRWARRSSCPALAVTTAVVPGALGADGSGAYAVAGDELVHIPP